MLDKNFLERVRRLIQTQLVERRKQLPREISRVKEEMNYRGSLYSGATIKKIEELCSQELEVRAMLVWQDLFRVMQVFGTQPSGELSADLKEVLKGYVDRSAEEIFELMKREKHLCRGNEIKFDEHGMKHQVLEKIGIEIDLYVDSLFQRLSREGEGERAGGAYNFYGPVGAVQTGTGASANVVQNLRAEDRKALVNALDEIKQSLERIEDIAGSEREELVELVLDSKAELEKPKPNNTKIRTILTQVGKTIQTVGSMHAAYQLLKSALVPLGIVLP